MGSKLAGSLGALPIFGARTLRYERRALSPQVHDFCALRQNEPNFIFLANDASGGAAAEKWPASNSSTRMAAARECACAIVSGQNSPNRSPVDVFGYPT